MYYLNTRIPLLTREQVTHCDSIIELLRRKGVRFGAGSKPLGTVKMYRIPTELQIRVRQVIHK